MTGAELAPAGAGSAWEIRKRQLGLPVEAEEALSSRASLRTVLRGQLECVMKTNSVSYLSIDWGVGSCGIPMLPCKLGPKNQRVGNRMA
jgi:hypothetical protein